MPIRARAADGSIHEFPDGTKPEVVDRAMKSYAQGSRPQQGAGNFVDAYWKEAGRLIPRMLPGPFGTLGKIAQAAFPQQTQGFVQRAVQAPTFGLSDELVSAVPAVAAAVRGQSPRQAFNAAQQQQRNSRDQFARTNPKTALAADVTGIGLSAAIPMGGASGAASLGGAALRSGVVGGAQGMLSGFGMSNGDLGDRTNAMVGGGLTGAALGAGLPYAAAVGGNLVQRVAPVVQSAMQRAAPMVEGAGRAIPAVDDLAGNVAMRMRAMAPDGVAGLSTPEQIALRNVARVGRSSGVGVDELQNAAPDLMAAEVFGPTGARQLGALARREGLTGQNLRTTVGERQQARPGILAGAFEQATGVRPGEASQIIADVVDTGQRNARPLYDAAFNDPIEMTDNLQELLNLPALQGARRRAYRLMQNDRIDPETMGFTVSPESGDIPILVPNGTPNLRVLDYIKRGLDGELRPFRNPVTGRIDTSDPEARQLVGIISEFRNELTSQSPNYRQALAVSGDYLSAQSAFEQAQRMLGNNMDEFDFQQTLNRMSEGERQAFRVGAAKWANDRAQTGKLTPQSLVGQPGARLRAKLTAALGEDSVAAIIDPATREAQKAAFEGRAGFVNSPSAELMLGNQEVDQALGAQNWSAGEAVMNPVGAVRGFMARSIDQAVDAAVGPGREAARNEMGRLFMMSPQQLAAYLEANPVNLPPPMFPGPRAPNPFSFRSAPSTASPSTRR
jgi:hypothetical protein